MEIILEWYYAKELIFLITQKLYHMTAKYWILWMPHAYIMFFKGKKVFTWVLITSLVSLHSQCGCVISAKKKKNEENIPSLVFHLF